MKRPRFNLRGVYPTEAGMFTVKAKRWWSPKDRKTARLAAKVTSMYEHEVMAEASKRISRLMFYGE